MDELTPQGLELNRFLSEFFIRVRKKEDTEEYEPYSLRAFFATVSVTNVVTHYHICPLTPSNVEVTFMFMDWSAKSNRQKQH